LTVVTGVTNSRDPELKLVSEKFTSKSIIPAGRPPEKKLEKGIVAGGGHVSRFMAAVKSRFPCRWFADWRCRVILNCKQTLKKKKKSEGAMVKEVCV